MSGERFWTSRILWRLRGASVWPVFVITTLLDGLILDMLPPVATTGLNYLEGVLIATFGNLFLVGALAPFLTKRLAQRRQVAPAGGAAPEVEVELLRDRVGSALLAAGVVASLASGLANRPLIVSETEASEENARVVQDFVNRSGDEELRRNIETANTIRLGEGYFRTCIARDDRDRFVCLLVDTEREPVDVRRDPSAVPNNLVRGRD
ncbi:MAG: hypothetical protein H0U14_06635 [Thermoleophilaceae bacterium]|nr:hypothetical protein [Thermoleophilaceae bacterium]